MKLKPAPRICEEFSTISASRVKCVHFYDLTLFYFFSPLCLITSSHIGKFDHEYQVGLSASSIIHARRTVK